MSSKIEKLVVESFGEIRKIGNNYSVHDILTVCGIKAARKTWSRLIKVYPEVGAFCHTFKFPGQGQQETPVTDREGLLQIIGLLPGHFGRTYRAEAARLIATMLSNPEEVVTELVTNAKSQEQAELIISKATTKYLETYHPLMDNVKARGGGKNSYIGLNQINTITIRGSKPSEIILRDGAKNGRDGMSLEETISMAFLQELENKKLDKVDAKGDTQILSTIKNVADKVKALIDDCTVQTITI